MRVLLRYQLFKILGEVCAHCGSVDNLTFDLKTPHLDDRHHRFNGYDRIKFYWTEHTHASNVQVLCEECNGRKGLLERPDSASHPGARRASA